MKKLLLPTIALSLALFACSKPAVDEAGSEEAAVKTISFAMEASFPPFESMDKNNNIVGFDVDLVNALCAQMQAKCSFKHQSFDSLIPDLKIKRIDAIASGMDVTPDRLKQVSFTTPYIANSATFIVKAENKSHEVSLENKNIGVQNGTTHQKFIEDTYGKNVSIKSYDSYQNAILDLKNGRLDYVFSDTLVAKDFLKQEAELALVGEEINNPEYFGIGMAIAVHPSNIELLNNLNAALVKIKENGDYNEIYKKWIN